MLKPYVDEIQVDRLENLIAIKKGQPKAPKIMLASHMDEVGLMVKTINKDGFLQFSKMGGIDDRILPAQKVTVFTKNSLPWYNRLKASHIQKEEERKNHSLRRPLYRHRSRKQRRRRQDGCGNRRSHRI